jgi:hypothetical protein
MVGTGVVCTTLTVVAVGAAVGGAASVRQEASPMSRAVSKCLIGFIAAQMVTFPGGGGNKQIVSVTKLPIVCYYVADV